MYKFFIAMRFIMLTVSHIKLNKRKNCKKDFLI